eukprot:jgi/Mesvir1/26567/Mv16222-RA.1
MTGIAAVDSVCLSKSDASLATWKLSADAASALVLESEHLGKKSVCARVAKAGTSAISGPVRVHKSASATGNLKTSLGAGGYASAPDTTAVSKAYADGDGKLKERWASTGLAGVTYVTGTPASGDALRYASSSWSYAPSVTVNRPFSYSPPPFGIIVPDSDVGRWVDARVGGSARNMFASNSGVQLQKVRFSVSDIPKGAGDGADSVCISLRVMDVAVDTTPYAGKVFRELSTGDVALGSVATFVDGKWVASGSFNLADTAGGRVDIAHGTGFRMQVKVDVNDPDLRAGGNITGTVRVYGRTGVVLTATGIQPSSSPTVVAGKTTIQVTHSYSPSDGTGNVGVMARLYQYQQAVTAEDMYENGAAGAEIASQTAALSSESGSIASVLTFTGLSPLTRYHVYLVAKTSSGYYSDMYWADITTLGEPALGETGVPKEMEVIDPTTLSPNGPGEGTDYVTINGYIYRLTNDNPDSGYSVDLSSILSLDASFTIAINITLPSGSFDADPTHDPNLLENVYFYIGANGPGASDNNTSIAMGTYNGGVWFKVADQQTATFANDVGIEAALGLHPGSQNSIVITRTVEADGDAIYTWVINGVQITGDETYQGSPVFVFNPQYEGAYPVFGTKTAEYPDGTPNNAPLGGQIPVGEYLSVQPPTLTNTSNQPGSSGGLVTNTGGALPDLTLNTQLGVLQGNSLHPDPIPLGDEQGIWTFYTGNGSNTGSVQSGALVTRGTFTVGANQQLQANLASGTSDYATIDLSNAGFNGELNPFTISVDYQHPGNLVGNLDNGAVWWYGNASSFIGLYHGGDGYLHVKTSYGDIATNVQVSDGTSHNIVLSRLTEATGGTITSSTTTTTVGSTWLGEWQFNSNLANTGTGTSLAFTAPAPSGGALIIAAASGSNTTYVRAEDIDTTGVASDDGYGEFMVEAQVKNQASGNTTTFNILTIGQDFSGQGNGYAIRLAHVNGGYIYIQTENQTVGGVTGIDYNLRMPVSNLAAISGTGIPTNGAYHSYRLARKSWSGTTTSNPSNLFQFWYDNVEIPMSNPAWQLTTNGVMYNVPIKKSYAHLRVGNIARFINGQTVYVDYVKFKNDILVPGTTTTTTTTSYNGMYKLYVDGVQVVIPSAPPELGNVSINTKTLTFGEDSQWGFNNVSRYATWDNIRFLNRAVTAAEVTKLSDANPTCPQYYTVTDTAFPDGNESFAVSVDYKPSITAVPGGQWLSGIVFDYGDPTGTQAYVRLRHDSAYNITLQVFDGVTLQSHVYSPPFTYGVHNFILERVAESGEWRLYVDGIAHPTVPFSAVHDASISIAALSVGWKLLSDSIQNAQWDNLRVFAVLPSDSVIHALGRGTYEQPDNLPDETLYLYGDAAGDASTAQAGNGYGPIAVAPTPVNPGDLNLPVMFTADQIEPVVCPDEPGDETSPIDLGLEIIDPLTGAVGTNNSTVITTASANISSVYVTGASYAPQTLSGETWLGVWDFNNNLDNTGSGISSAFVTSLVPSTYTLTVPTSTGNNYVKAADMSTSNVLYDDGFGAFTVEIKAKSSSTSNNACYLFSIGQDFTSAGGGHVISLYTYFNGIYIETETLGGSYRTVTIPSATITSLATTAGTPHNGNYHVYRLTRKSHNREGQSLPSTLFSLWYDGIEIPLNHPDIPSSRLYNVPIKSAWGYIRIGRHGRSRLTGQSFTVDYVRFKNDMTVTLGGAFRALLELDVGTNLSKAMVAYVDASLSIRSGVIADYSFDWITTDDGRTIIYRGNNGVGATGDIAAFGNVGGGSPSSNTISIDTGSRLYVPLSPEDWTSTSREVSFSTRVKMVRNSFSPFDTYVILFGDVSNAPYSPPPNGISLKLKYSDRILYINETTAVSGVTNLDDSSWHTYTFARVPYDSVTDAYTLSVDGAQRAVVNLPRVTVQMPDVNMVCGGYYMHIDSLQVTTPVVSTVAASGKVCGLSVDSTAYGSVDLKNWYYTSSEGFSMSPVTSFGDTRFTSMSKLWLANTRDVFGHWRSYISASGKKPDRLSEMTPVPWTLPNEADHVHPLRLAVALNDPSGTGAAQYERDYLRVHGHIHGSYRWDNTRTHVYKDAFTPASNAVENTHVSYSNNHLTATKLAGSGTEVFWRDYLPNGKWYIEFDLAYTAPTSSGSISFGLRRFDNGGASYQEDHNSASAGTYGVAVDLLSGTGRMWTRGPGGAWTSGDPAYGTGGVALDTLSTQWWLFVRLPNDGAVTTRNTPSRAEQNPVTHSAPAGFSWYTYSDATPERRTTFGIVYPTLTQYNASLASGVMSVLMLNGSTASDPYLTQNGTYKSVTTASNANNVLSAAKCAALVTDLVFDGAFSILWLWEGVGTSLFNSRQTVSVVEDTRPLLIDSTLTQDGTSGVAGWYRNTSSSALFRKSVMFATPALVSGSLAGVTYAGGSAGSVTGTLSSAQLMLPLWVAFVRDAGGNMSMYFSSSATKPSKLADMTPGASAVSGYQSAPTNTNRLRVILSSFDEKSRLTLYGSLS